MKVAIIGYGGRGRLYSKLLIDKGTEITALCDVSENKLQLAEKERGLTKDKLYLSDEEFFKKGKLGDILFVCTQDKLHVRHAIMGMRAGYDLLLEKPIATTVSECNEILNEAKKLKRTVFVCHVLRYSPFFYEIKNELDEGDFGKVITMTMTENVAYWHDAHSYVRGNWRNWKDSSPMMIAKCCHDLDIINWFMGAKMVSVSSFGGLEVFKAENAPEGAANFCLDCKYKSSCPYSAETIYIKDRAEKGHLGWPCEIVVSEPTVEKLYTALKDGPYGRCVYRCDNNVVDHQVVNINFESDRTAQLTMTAFSKDCYREVHLHCENGDISGNTLDNKVFFNLYSGKSYCKDINIIKDSAYGHGGGDKIMIDRISDYYNGTINQLETSIENSIQSHFVGFAADKSMKHNGKVIRL